MKSAITIARQNRYAAGISTIGQSEVGFAVAVEVADRDGRASSGVFNGGLEGSIALAQKHRDSAAWKIPAIEQPEKHRAGIHRDQVGLAVAIKVPHGDGKKVRSDIVVDGDLEGAVAVAQQHGEPRARGHNQVSLTVGVKVAHDERTGRRTHNVVDEGLKGAIAFAQQNRDTAVRISSAALVPRAGVGNRHIKISVAIEIVHRQ